MVKILCNGESFYLNKVLKQSLDIQISDIKNKNQDLVIVIDGKEGSGKSKKSRQIAYYCAQQLGVNFGVDNIHFDLKEYIEGSLKGGKYSINLLDEGRKLLNKKRSNSREAVTFTNFLSECRDMRQIHIILLPAFHDLDSYVVLWRMDLLIHLEKYHVADLKSDIGWRLVLGDYKVFDNNNVLKKFYNFKYNYPKNYSIKDKFSNFEVLEDFESYEIKKSLYTVKKYSQEEEEDVKNGKFFPFVSREARADAIIDYKDSGMSSMLIAKTVRLHQRTIFKEIEWRRINN